MTFVVALIALIAALVVPTALTGAVVTYYRHRRVPDYEHIAAMEIELGYRPTADESVVADRGMVRMTLPGSTGTAFTTRDAYENYWKAKGWQV